jgi:hypothetical protein
VDCGTYSCRAGNKCASGHQCLDQTAVDCGNGRSCPERHLCIQGGKECLTQEEIAHRQAEERAQIEAARAAREAAERQRIAEQQEAARRKQAELERQQAEKQQRLDRAKVASLEIAKDKTVLAAAQSGTITAPATVQDPKPAGNVVSAPSTTLAPPSKITLQGQSPQTGIPALPTLNAGQTLAAIEGARVLGAVTAGLSGARTAARATGEVTGVYGAFADGYKTFNDIAQHKGTVPVAHDVETDLFDVINAATFKDAGPLKSFGISTLEQKATAKAEDYLSNLIYNTYYKPKQ